MKASRKKAQESQKDCRFVYWSLTEADEDALCRRLSRLVGKRQRVISIGSIVMLRNGKTAFGVYLENLETKGGAA